MTASPLRGRISFDGTATPTKTALFLVVCGAWLLPGLVGHDPWKADEAVAFGSVVEMLRNGDWIVFRVAGEPYLEKAPLFLWVAGVLAKLLGGLLPLHDAARLASGVFMTATLAELTRRGVLSVDAGPSGLTVAAINKYLELKAAAKV